VKEGEEMRPSKGGNEGPNRSGPLHGVGGGWRSAWRHGGRRMAACSADMRKKEGERGAQAE
jgi:hypothetical protein